MGVILREDTGRLSTLGARCILGRHPRCELCVDDPRISSEHAGLYWLEDRWQLRDLGSRNGTFVEGRRLAAGERLFLVEGARFSLGREGVCFFLVDAAPPMMGARRAQDALVREGSFGVLLLPNDELPLASVFEDEEGGYVIEDEEGTRRVADQEIVIVGGEAWVLLLPGSEAATLESESVRPSLGTVALRLCVSRDEEHVEATVIHEGRATQLPSRSHHYLLVTLARVWLSESSLPPAERGWVERDALCQMLLSDTNKLNVEIFRARKQLAALGLEGAAGIIARRPGTGQIRIGIERVEVVSM